MSAPGAGPLAWKAAMSRRPGPASVWALVGLSLLLCAAALASRPRTSVVEPPARALEAPARGDEVATSEWTRRAMTPIAEVPADVLLKIAQANMPDRGGLCAIVDGVRRPGEEVRVDGKLVRAPAGARYRVQVQRKPRRGAFEVVTRDASGRVEERRIPCEAEGEEIQDLAMDWTSEQAAPPCASPQRAGRRAVSERGACGGAAVDERAR